MRLVTGIVYVVAFAVVLAIALYRALLESAVGPSSAEIAARPETRLAPAGATRIETTTSEGALGTIFPTSGASVASRYETRESFASVAEFYDRALADRGWRVASGDGDPFRQWCGFGFVADAYPVRPVVEPTAFTFAIRGAEAGRPAACFLGPPHRATAALLAVLSFTVYLAVAQVAAFAARRRRARRVGRESGIAAWAPFFAWIPYGVLASGVGPQVWLPDAVVWSGVACTVAGIVFALWALATIGRHFDLELEVHADHEIVRRGPYDLVRHPIYTGLLIHTLGAFLATTNVLFLAGSVLGTFPVLYARARNEERLLRERLGAAYEAYQRDVGMFIPFVGRARDGIATRPG